MKVSVLLGSLGTGSLKKDLQRAMAIGVHGVQLDVADTEIDTRELSQSGREDLAAYLESMGIEVAALRGLRRGFGDSATLDESVNRTRAMLDFCLELHAKVLTVGLGDMNVADPAGISSEAIAAARELAEYAAARECRLAMDTGAASAASIQSFLRTVDCEGLRVNLCPADRVMNGFDLFSDAAALANDISHVFAQDAAEGSAREGRPQLLPLGKGGVRYTEFVPRLLELGYSGFLTVAPEGADEGMAAVVEAVSFLNRQKGIDP